MTHEIHAPRGTTLTCKNWLIETPYRMLQNNLDPVAGDPQNLIVYDGAARMVAGGADLSWRDSQRRRRRCEQG